MKEILVISGKGGTGKTSVTTSLCALGGKDIVAADCDVDAADMHILLKPDFKVKRDFYSGELAVIDPELCVSCDICYQVCRFDSITPGDDTYKITDIDCEGCGYCSHVCPTKAITMVEQVVGQLYISKIKTGATMVHAALGIGAENTGKLVTEVKNEAKRIAKENGIEYIIVDGSPGIGCPVISSLSGADFVLLVTEPTVSGIHDLKRVHELVKKFHIKSGCVINKYDLNQTVADEIKEFLKEENIIHIADIPYHKAFTEAMTVGLTIAEYDNKELKKIMIDIYSQLLELTKNK
ncbi:MAG: ATP-binding protein [Chlorobi bacterium]|nr:ATP-binding protein [Chlorobiota bacterium]